MAIYSGLEASFGHPENGMIRQDMIAAATVANQLDEVIIFRSTGPWSRRWIERGYPTKNFHVKGKSSDWGPQAGFVPYEGIYSKVGHDTQKAKDGKADNDHGLSTSYAKKRQLFLTLEELKLQVEKAEEKPPRTAVKEMVPVPLANSKDYFLFAERSGDGKKFAFRATWSATANVYDIFVYPENAARDPKKLIYEPAVPLEVMTSSEKGAHNRPMTGDYDLMAICPRWANYMSRSTAEISKPGLTFSKLGAQPGQTFAAGSYLDKTLDMRTNTGALPRGAGRSTDADGWKNPAQTYAGTTKRSNVDEHPDMGNLTPRILRCINALNAAMPSGSGAFRRVHHNAESHRNHVYGAANRAGMAKGDCFPLTVFQPTALVSPNSPTARYLNVSTLEQLSEFEQYAVLLNEAGYFVPKNWVWGMSIRDLADARLASSRPLAGR